MTARLKTNIGIIVFLVCCAALPASGASGPEMMAAKVRRSLPQSVSQATPGAAKTLLPDGTWLLTGGEGPGGPLSTAAILDPQTGKVTALPNGLRHARAWHSATVLPDGSVLIFGGLAQDEQTVKESEAFNPSTQRFAPIGTEGLTPRAHHTATLLLNGAVLIVGGNSQDGGFVGHLELWDSRTHGVSTVPASLLVPRRDQAASLLPNGDVLFWGGTDKQSSPLNFGEVFDVRTLRVRMETQPPQKLSSEDSFRVTLSIPDDRAENVPASTAIAVLFSKPVRMPSVNSSTATLTGPSGGVPAIVVPAEGGRLAFVTPTRLLTRDTTFSLALDGLTDATGQPLSRTEITFTTVADSSSGSSSKSGVGVVGGMPTPGSGETPFDPRARQLPPLQARPGVTALAGQTLQLNGKPLEHVKIEIDDERTFTDETGRFLLKGISPGHHVMNVFGETAVEPRRPYGFFQIAVDIVGGKTNVLPFTMFIPVLDVAHAVKFSSPTKGEVVGTTPLIPGLEIHIPQAMYCAGLTASRLPPSR